jgi:glycine/D-amino acid oxidase-like deaminating enzyme
MTSRRRALVAGAGIFGVSAARTLRARGWDVTLVDPGPLPHPDAASTDISKIVRSEYGDDAVYTDLALRGLEAWRRHNRDLALRFHETGVLFARREGPRDDSFEGRSLAHARGLGAVHEILEGDELAARFPAWAPAAHRWGMFNRAGGWVESGAAVGDLVRRALAEGVTVRGDARVTSLVTRGDRVQGAVVAGARVDADAVVLCLGAWTTDLVPSLRGVLTATGHPVFHLRPREPARFDGARFPVFGAAIAETGWYGFPLHPTEGVVKVARHGAGRVMHASSPARAVTADETEAMWRFVRASLPALGDAALVRTRLCMYSDAPDGHLLLDRDPAQLGLVVAAGDAGHAFKFGPALGPLVADVVEGAAPLARWAWRTGGAAPTADAARAR